MKSVKFSKNLIFTNIKSLTHIPIEIHQILKTIDIYKHKELNTHTYRMKYIKFSKPLISTNLKSFTFIPIE